MKIYFAGSIRGGREDAKIYKKLVDYLSSFGEVLTEHVADMGLTAVGEDGPNDVYIYKRDMKWLGQAEVLIAEVTSPSLGVGYELAKAEERKLPILCLYRQQKGKRLSALVGGNKKFLVKEYSSLKEAMSIISKFVEASYSR